MFSKTFFAAIGVLALGLQAHAHAAIAPQLGVKGVPVRNDVQRPTANAACGTTNVAQTLDSSTPVTANAQGAFSVNITNFNAGKDGSTQVTAQVDPTAKGTAFATALDVTKNGVLAPTAAGTTQLTAQLPAGTKCTGGKTGDLCLASFKTAGGFGNCVVVKQAGAAKRDWRAVGARAARAYLAGESA
ncbi:hypothetical protein PLICRDRAFT_141880 [Plicaturopsis crispa FD-325 SS-3]|nr:hypothetical protein PLICRDRAFT_141880 [Plicaturopsis crispa FD-325 SS-3]